MMWCNSLYDQVFVNPVSPTEESRRVQSNIHFVAVTRIGLITVLGGVHQ